MLMQLVALSALAALQDIRITRAQPDKSAFASNTKQLTRFMMDAMYGECRPLSAAWAQRGVLDATATSDLSSRIAYYEEARGSGAPRGAVLVAEAADGSICGFADVGASLWLPNDAAFRLPLSPDLRRLAETRVGTDGQLKPGVELRPYISNLVVDSRLRRRGVGRRLMEACEAEAETWAAACNGAGGDTCQDLWLEVTATNEAALGFYESLGYREDGRTVGNEGERRRFEAA